MNRVCAVCGGEFEARGKASQKLTCSDVCRDFHRKKSRLAWYYKNVETERAKGAAWKRENKERCQNFTKDWRARNQEKVREYCRNAKVRNHEKIIERDRIRNKSKERKAWKVSNQAKRTAAMRAIRELGIKI